MKRILLLCLCLSLLFSLGCKEELLEQDTRTGAWGEFYSKDGYVQSSLIVAMMDTTELTAPVTELAYTLHDNTDFGIVVTYYTDTNDHRLHRLEVYENGEWKEAPYSGDTMTSRAFPYETDTDPQAHRKLDFTMDMHQREDPAIIRYDPLQPGAYRLIVTYTLSTDDPDVTIPKRQHASVLYFTVL